MNTVKSRPFRGPDYDRGVGDEREEKSQRRKTLGERVREKNDPNLTLREGYGEAVVVFVAGHDGGEERGGKDAAAGDEPGGGAP